MKKIFYGWWMVGAGSVMQFVQGTLLLHAFGAYFAVLRDDRGWSKTELSGAAAIAIGGGRAPAFASGVLIIAICLPISFIIRHRPEDYGLRMDGAAPGSPDSISGLKDEKRDATRDFTAREALRTQAFWLLSLGHGFALFVVMGVNTHAITHMKEGLGYSIEVASLVITLQTVAQLCGVGIGAWIGDRLNN